MAKRGWWWPLRARKAHYFVDGRSLCGRWGHHGAGQDFWLESSHNCAECKRRREKLVKEQPPKEAPDA